MLFNTEEKNMMVGAFATGGVQAVMDAYYGFRLASGTNIATTPSDPAYWLYTNFNLWLPNLSQIIPWFAMPTIFWYIGKKKHSSKLKSIAMGGLVFGIAELVGTTAFKLSAVATGQTYRVMGVR